MAVLTDAYAVAPSPLRPRVVLRQASASHVGFGTAAVLFTGLILAIVTTPDPLWWQLHFSQLGTFDAFSGHVFNATILLTSAGVVVFAMRLRREMAQRARTCELTSRRGALIVPILIALLGVHLSVVGFVPVSTNEFLHDRGSTGAVFCFVGILSSSRWTLRGMHRDVARMTRFVALGLVLATAPYIAGFINLAAFELVVFSLIFSWLLALARNVRRPAGTTPARPAARATGSMRETVVIAPRESVTFGAQRDAVPAGSRARIPNLPRRSAPARRRIARGLTRQPDPDGRPVHERRLQVDHR